MAGWILKSSDPDLTLRIAPGSIKAIGRSAQAEFIVEAPLVSRLHCRLTVDASDQLLAEDLESTNGIQVNGAKVDRAMMKAGDILTVGRVNFGITRA